MSERVHFYIKGSGTFNSIAKKTTSNAVQIHKENKITLTYILTERWYTGVLTSADENGLPVQKKLTCERLRTMS